METEKATNKRHLEREKNKHQRADLTDLNDAKDQLPDLPSEIIVDILSRLDVKSLLRFRCVQKSWASLVSDPKFVNTHMIRHSMKSHNIVMDSTKSDRKSCTLLHSIFHNSYFSKIKLDFVQEYFSVYGSCNGLVCLVTWKDIYLWNPSTRESKKLPRFQFLDCSSEYFSDCVFGFGYDNSKNDFKVVIHRNEFTGLVRTQAHIYSLRTNSWRRIDPTYRGIVLGKPVKCLIKFVHRMNRPPFCIDYPNILGSEPIKCINGIVHWLIRPPHSDYPRSIVTFDLAEETYGQVPQPIYGDGSWLWSLGELEGSLGLLTDNSENRADVWVLKIYGVNGSWSKLFSISYVENPGLFRHKEDIAFVKVFNIPFPVSISKNGEIVLEVGRDLVLYSDKDKTFTYFLDSPCESHCNMQSFVESLVSPNAYDKYREARTII